MKRINILLICAAVLFSCGTKTKDKQQQSPNAIAKTEKENTPFYLDFTKNTEKIDALKLSDIADSVEYIPLDVTNRVLISKIQGLEIAGQLILIRDKGATYLFNSSGQFQKSLYSLGRGPGEAYGTHIAIDNKNKKCLCREQMDYENNELHNQR